MFGRGLGARAPVSSTMGPRPPPVGSPEEILIAVAVDRDKILQAAQKLVEKKRYDKAIVEYQKLVADDPKDVRTLLKIGDLYLKMEQHADAIGTYEHVGQFYSAQGLHLKAIAVYKQIREIIHKHVPHLEDRFGHITPKLAQTYAQLGLTSDALAAYDEVATRYQRAGRDRDAIDVFRKVVDLDPQNPLPHLRLAEAFMRVRDVDDAIQRFAAAAEILLKLGRRDDALKVVERLLQHRADVRFARVAAEIYLERSDPADAMAALSKLQIRFKENPKDLETLGLLARAFDKLGQPAKSVEVQKEAARIAKDAGRLDHFNALVEALLTRAPLDEGVRQLVAMRAAEKDPVAAPPPAAPAARAVPAHAAEPPPRRDAVRIPQPSTVELDIDDAEVILDEDSAASSAAPFALRQSSVPDEPQGTAEPSARLRQIVSRVDAYRHAKDYDRAVALLFEAVEELPGARELREKLCDVLIEAGDQAEAVRQMLGFARWLAGEGDVETATRILDEVLLLEPGQQEALQTLRELGYAVPTDEAAGYVGDAQQAGYAEGGGSLRPPRCRSPRRTIRARRSRRTISKRSAPTRPSGAAAPTTTTAPSRRASSTIPSARRRCPASRWRTRGPRSTPDPRLVRDRRAPVAPVGHAAQRRPARWVAEPRAAALRGGDGGEAAPAEPRPARRGGAGGGRVLRLERDVRRSAQPARGAARAAAKPPAPDRAAARARGARRRGARRRERDASGAPGRVPRRARGHAGVHALRGSELRHRRLAGRPRRARRRAAAGRKRQEGSQVSVESVFEQFKAGVAASIPESDAATHYDLGVAYKEMGLVTDAIAEFELAARDPGRECVCNSMMG